MWTMLAIFFLAILWFNMPRGFYEDFVYTGDSDSLLASMRYISTPYHLYVNFLDAIRNALAAIRVFSISAAYCLVFINREKKGHCFEKICAFSRSRIPLYLSNLLTMAASMLVFSAVAILAMLTLVLSEQPYIVHSPVREYLIFFACYISFVVAAVAVMYSLYLITRSVLVPLILATVVSLIGLVDTLTKPVPVMHFFVEVLDIQAHLDYLRTIKDWARGSKFLLACCIVSGVLILITSIVISKRDLD